MTDKSPLPTPPDAATIEAAALDIVIEDRRLFNIKTPKELAVKMAWYRWAKKQDGEALGTAVVLMQNRFPVGPLWALLGEAYHRLKNTKPR